MLLLSLFACPGADSTVAGTPETCTVRPSAAWSTGTAYVETTSAWGLDGVTGELYPSVDVDGDGRPDLLVNEIFTDELDDPDAGLFLHRLLLNSDNGAGGRMFVDNTVASGILQNRAGGVGTSGSMMLLADVDGDGDNDLYSGRYRAKSDPDTTQVYDELYLNDGTGHFTLKEDAGVWSEEEYPLQSATFVDVDADGHLDLFEVGWYKDYGVSNDAAEPRLFHGNGDGSFADVSDAALPDLKSSGSTTNSLERGHRRPAMGSTACDVDGDSFDDLVQSNYGRSWNFLFHNRGDGTFDEVGQDAFVDADADLDYSDNWYYACYCKVYGGCDALPPTVDCPSTDYAPYWTAGYDDQEARLGGNTFSHVCTDIDNDGDMDLWETDIAHDWAGLSSDPSQLLLNDGAGTFTRQDNETVGLARHRNTYSGWNEGDIWGAAGDFDNDGWLDLFLVSTDYPDTTMHLFRQVSPGVFQEVSDDTGMNQEWPYGIALVDFDDDGDLDLVTGSSIARSGTPWTEHTTHFWENQLGGNYVRIAGLPVGTRVEVTAGGVTQTQEVQAGFAHGGVENDLSLHFGLGDGCMIDSIRATAPGGATAEWTDKAGNQTLNLSM